MRYKITIEYDGTNLLGWQKQLDGPSVQQYLEEALIGFAKNNLVELDESEENNEQTFKLSNANICKNDGFSEEDGVASTERSRRTQRLGGTDICVRENTSTEKLLKLSNKTIIQGAGRTDAGVHALAQVAHFDLKKAMEPFRIREAFNAHLKINNAPVAVLDVEPVSDEFHARYSAKGRGYIYRILNRRAPSALERNRVWWVPVPLDIEKMRQGAAWLIGHHDFSSFRASACQALSPIKTLDKIDITTRGEEIIFEVEARSFLHHQVRNIVGSLKMVGDGHLHPYDIKKILEAKNRSAAGVTAPAEGLYLSKVKY